MNKASRMLKRFLCLLVVAIVILFSPIFDRVVNFLFDKDIPLIIISPVEDKVRGIITLDILVFDTSNPIKVNIQLNKKKVDAVYPLIINTTRFPDGVCVLEVEATDSSIRKNRAVNTVEFTIDNTPPLVEIVLEKEILEPGGILQGWINLKEKASIEAKIDGENLILLETEPANIQNSESYLLSFFFIYGIPLNEESLLKEMSIEAVDEVGNKTTKLITYKLRDRKFPTEYLSIAEEKTPLLDIKLLREERKIVEEALNKTSKGIYWEGDFIPPVNSVVTSPFGSKRIYNQGLLIDRHKGLDYRAKKGTGIQATNSGFVVLSEFLKARGGTVIIDHGMGVMSLYYHLEEIMVKVGDRVKKGQFIGKAGDTGITTAPHLHFEMRIRVVAVDPNHFYGGK
ncbi:M23 family metallopeptidase [Candidatus Hakubella thermalkaliphila]|uniref:Murein DD-endopeptidase n=1 Tax=Candidatus Hakubella thermalkaliphila TaxID=2754717 RepID=A0A6V8P6M4_9ACTN|nr:M23 family metallopeptidase [Candidatus Hakubella thermalkaliphila]GFP28048.1 murein DD-endopeptidase [Candidatus Hakubella thermalkaliphila]